jgi:hypothetical protein
LQFGKDAVVHPFRHLLKIDQRLNQLYTSFEGSIRLFFKFFSPPLVLTHFDHLTDPYQAQHTPHGMPTPIGVPSTPFAPPHPFIFNHEHISAHAPTFNTFDHSFNAQVPSHLNTSLNANLTTTATQHTYTHPQKNTSCYGDTPLSIDGEGEDEASEEDEEEDMDQEANEENNQKDHDTDNKCINRPIVPPNPTPHSFQHTTHDPTTSYMAHNYYTQSLNSIPMLELDPKDEKFGTAGANDRQRYPSFLPSPLELTLC